MMSTATFSEDHLLRICDALASSGSGLTGTEIGTFLLRLDMADPGAGISKRSRLFEALQNRQQRDQDARAVITFIHAAMEPRRYVGTAKLFELRRVHLNNVLKELDLEVGEDGKIQPMTSEAKDDAPEQRAHALAQLLETRNLHPEVTQQLRRDAPDASRYKLAVGLVLTLSDRIRHISGLTCDGTELVDRAFGGLSSGRLPLVALADLATDSGRSEQASLMGLTKGFLSTFRSTAGYAPRIPWELKEADLMDLAALASLLHRKLDSAIRMRRSHELYSKDAPPARLISH